MLGFFKNLMGERGKAPETQPAPPPAAKETGKETPSAATSADPAPVPHLTPTPSPSGGYRPKPKLERVLLPLKGITDTFPAELQPVIANAPAPTVIVAISIETVLEQLVNGRVAVPLAELKRISPVNIFVADTARDQESIEIPLDLLLEKLDPTVLPRNIQRRVEVPQEIAPVFNRQGAAKPEAVSVATPPPTQPQPAASAAAPPPVPPKPAPAKKEAAPPPIPPQDAKKKSGFLTASPELQEFFETQRKSPPETPPPETSPAPAPTLKVEPVREMPQPVAPPPRVAPSAAPARPAAPPAPSTKPAAPAVIKLQVKQPSPTPPPRQPVVDAPGVRRPVAPAPASQSAGGALPIAARLKNATPASEIASSVVVQLPLAEASKGWPETIREELAGAPPDSAIHYPAPELGAALKSGKVQVPWKQLRSWIRPPLKTPADPLYTDALVELPLPVVVPLFMAAAAPGRSLHQVVVNEQIPTPFARSTPPPPAPPKVEPAAKAEPAAPEPNRVGALGLDGKLPAELVDRACQLAGVAGAVIALKEGLVVASKVPPEMKPETLGAFLPQLFSRVEQSIGSMEIGDLQSLQFIAGDRPWQIWSAGPVLFAAVGRPNELLPGAQLKIIAAQLARQTKR